MSETPLSVQRAVVKRWTAKTFNTGTAKQVDAMMEITIRRTFGLLQVKGLIEKRGARWFVRDGPTP